MKPESLRTLERALEKETGLSIETLRETPVDEMRRQVEAKTGKSLKLTSVYDGVKILTSDQVDALLSKALKGVPKTKRPR